MSHLGQVKMGEERVLDQLEQELVLFGWHFACLGRQLVADSSS